MKLFPSIAAIAIATGAAGAAQAAYYTVTDFSATLGSYNLRDVNNAGQVTGCASSGCFLWSAADGFRSLPFTPIALNNVGQIVYQGNDGYKIWSSDGTVTALGTKSQPGQYQGVTALNDNGIAGGNYQQYTLDQLLAARYSPDYIRALAGSSQLVPRDVAAIANDGTLIGLATAGFGGSAKPYISKGDELFSSFIPTLNSNGSGSVSDINQSGMVVGSSLVQGSNSITHAFTWSEADGPIDIGTAGGKTSSSAMAISDLGDIVGYSSNSFQDHIATIWRGGTAYDINDYVDQYAGLFVEAKDINSSGMVIATIQTGASSYRNVILTPNGRFVANPPSPAPEPAGWAMMIFGFGLVGTGLRQRRAARVRFG